MSDGAKKNDSDKLRYDLIPPIPLEALAAVYSLGAKKYGAHNWRKGLAWSRVYAALMRHLQAWWQGETHAQDDGQHHLASVLWCAVTLMEYERTGTGEDDRDEYGLTTTPNYGLPPEPLPSPQHPLEDRESHSSRFGNCYGGVGDC